MEVLVAAESVRWTVTVDEVDMEGDLDSCVL